MPFFVPPGFISCVYIILRCFLPSSNCQGFHGTKSQLSSFQTSLQNTEFCDSIRYQMKMFPFVQLFLGRTSPRSSTTARFLDPCGSEPVLMHSFQLPLALTLVVNSTRSPLSTPTATSVSVSNAFLLWIGATPSCNKHLETDGLFPSRVQCVTLPGGREGKA